MIPGIGAGFALSGGSSEANASTDAGLTGNAAVNFSGGNKGPDQKTILLMIGGGLLAVGLLAVALRSN